MKDEKSIILMTKFALYDKNQGASDRKKCSFYATDYVYYKNRWTRLFAVFGCVIVLIFYWMHKIVVESVDILALDLKQVIMEALIFIGIVLVIYTAIGSVKALIEHAEANRRLKNYFVLLNRLDNLKGALNEKKRK